MSAAPVLTVWLQLLGLLASEVALVVVAAALLQRSTKSAWWRRTIWQVCVSSLLALPLFELSGAAPRDGRLAGEDNPYRQRWIGNRHRSRPKRRARVSAAS